MFDILIKNGFVINGTGNPWFRAHIGIKSDKIARIGNLNNKNAERVINAKDLAVAPGFIDIHTHSEYFLLLNPFGESKVRQGVTTEVGGNCGTSAAPLVGESVAVAHDDIKMYGLESKLELDWTSMKEYLDKLENRGISINFASLVGHGMIRASAMGLEDKKPTRGELNKMKLLLSRAMEEGAYGMSGGLVYTPSCYADVNELVELSKVVRQFDGLFAVHIRSSGNRLIQAVKEVIDVAKKSGVRLQISHHKACGKKNWGKVKATLKIIDKARSEGIDVACDQYPYLATSQGLDSEIPIWAREGGSQKLVARIKDKHLRDRIKKGMEHRREEWDNVTISLVGSRKNKRFEGKSVSEIAESKKKDPRAVVLDLIAEEKNAVMSINFLMCEENLSIILRHSVAAIASDGSSYATYGVLSRGKPHPRSYGTFPKVLGEYSKKKKILLLEEAVRKMTSLPAQRLGIKDRGLIREGMYADIVIFNPKKIIDRASYARPHQYPQGVEYVIVNGKIVVEREKHTGALAGKVLRHCVYT